MKPIIGIITRKSLSETNKKINIIYEDIEKSVIKSNGIPIGVSINNIENYLNICKGFIFQGGDDIDNENLNLLKILKEIKIPTLAICLGMQEMAISNHGELSDVENHLNENLHEITIFKDTLLYKIIKEEQIMVNSRHKSAIKNCDLLISSISKDNIIESIEDKAHPFFLGVEWHPENTYDQDINSKKIFDYFIEKCQ